MNDQVQIEFSRASRDSGMKQAADHADYVSKDWCERAYRYLKLYINSGNLKKKFKIEDVRELAKSAVFLEDPPSLRAWGAVTMRAAREGMIKRVGYTQVKNPNANRANVSVWQKV